jgi:hypothetical protein
MYRMYCPEDDGYSIGFPARLLRSMAQAQKFSLWPCIYNVEKQTKIIQQLVERIVRDFDDYRNSGDGSAVRQRNTENIDLWYGNQIGNIASDLIMFRLILFKHPSFEHESEWRLIRTITTYQVDDSKGRDGRECWDKGHFRYRVSIRGVTPYILFWLDDFKLQSSEENRLWIELAPSSIRGSLREPAVELMFRKFSATARTFDTSYQAR